MIIKGQMYNMPFNMNTFHKIWGVITPAEAKAKIEEQVKEYGVKEPKNLEEQAMQPGWKRYLRDAGQGVH